MNQTDLVVIRTYRDRAAADIARSALEAAAIDSMIEGSDVRGPALWMVGYKLLVRAEDAAQAAEILGQAT